MSNGIILPYNVTAESGIIATLLQNPSMIDHHDELKASHFYLKEYASLYWAIQELVQDGYQKIDKLALMMQIDKKKYVKNFIDEVGGHTFIDSVIEMSPDIARDNEEDYKNLCIEVSISAFRRHSYSAFKKYEKMVLDESMDLSEVHLKIVEELDNLGEDFISSEKTVLYCDRIDDVLAKMEEKRKRSADGIIGMPTAWNALSEQVRYEDGDLYLFAGRRKAGKSLILTQEAMAKAKSGLSVAMFSTEMSDEKDTMRMLSILSGIPIEDIRRGRILDHNEQKYLDAIHTLKNIKFDRQYNPRWTREAVNIKLKAVKHKLGGMDFFVYDYIKDQESGTSTEKYNELGKWADYLKNQIAGGYEIPVISAVQLNRSGIIADSDNIERYATCGIKWEKKTREEIVADSPECGNYKMNIFFSRDGGDMDEEDYLDFFMDDRKEKTNLRIYEAKEQHEVQVPAFMNSEYDD